MSAIMVLLACARTHTHTHARTHACTHARTWVHACVRKWTHAHNKSTHLLKNFWTHDTADAVIHCVLLHDLLIFTYLICWSWASCSMWWGWSERNFYKYYLIMHLISCASIILLYRSLIDNLCHKVKYDLFRSFLCSCKAFPVNYNFTDQILQCLLTCFCSSVFIFDMNV